MKLRELLPNTSWRMLKAVEDIKSGRKTWRQSAIDNGVTESGIHYALKRAEAAAVKAQAGRQGSRS